MLLMLRKQFIKQLLKKYKVFNIGSNKLYSIKDLSKILIKIVKSKSKLIIKKSMNNSNYKYNISSLEAKKIYSGVLKFQLLMD